MGKQTSLPTMALIAPIMKVLVSGAQAYDEPSWSAVVVIPAA